jgi:hypothetical protein
MLSEPVVPPGTLPAQIEEEVAVERLATGWVAEGVYGDPDAYRVAEAEGALVPPPQAVGDAKAWLRRQRRYRFREAGRAARIRAAGRVRPARRARPRGAGRPRVRARAAGRGGDSGDDSSDDPESDPPLGGALAGAWGAA